MRKRCQGDEEKGGSMKSLLLNGVVASWLRRLLCLEMLD